jgi:hypothetical protein
MSESHGSPTRCSRRRFAARLSAPVMRKTRDRHDQAATIFLTRRFFSFRSACHRSY